MRQTFITTICLVLIPLAVVLTGCPAEECRQMKACCAEVSDREWVGDSCGDLAKDVQDPNTCRTIVRTIRQSAESHDETIPEACR